MPSIERREGLAGAAPGCRGLIAMIVLQGRLRLEPGGRCNFPSARYRVNTADMAKQATVLTKKRKGPAPTGKGTLVGVRLQPDQLAALDAWIARAPGPLSRPEAIRSILREKIR